MCECVRVSAAVFVLVLFVLSQGLFFERKGRWEGLPMAAPGLDPLDPDAARHDMVELSQAAPVWTEVQELCAHTMIELIKDKLMQKVDARIVQHALLPLLYVYSSDATSYKTRKQAASIKRGHAHICRQGYKNEVYLQEPPLFCVIYIHIYIYIYIYIYMFLYL